MSQGWFHQAGGILCALLLAASNTGRAGEAELRARIEANGREITALREQVRQLTSPESATGSPASGLTEDAVQAITARYLEDHPGAGMPPSVQVGYSRDAGFVIRSAPNPAYTNWQDESRIPFELRTHVRVNVAYIHYTVADQTNHLTQQHLVTPVGDYSQLMVKRAQVILDGTLFDPDLRFRFTLHGDTRGLPAGFQNNKVVQTAGSFTPSGAPVSILGGGVFLDNAVRMNDAWVAYDFHPLQDRSGPQAKGPDAPVLYTPTFTLIAGKKKPFFGLEEYLGSAMEQFVEYPMASLMFDPDDDNLMTTAGFQVRALDNRFFLEATLTNGSESITPNALMDRLPGFISGFWYDFGGSWNAAKKTLDLFGPCVSDLDFSARPVVRAGGSINLVPLDRRSIYGDAEQGRFFVTPGGPNGTRLINVLNGDGTPAPGFPAGAHAVDEFNAYSFNTFLAAKYHGWSLLNEWWLRDLNRLETVPAGGNLIIYQDALGPGGTSANALFTPHHDLIDLGMNLQTGYFLIPKRLEVAVRWSWVRGQSGDINGDHTFTTLTVPGVVGPVHLVQGAFTHFRQANEYTLGLNYYFKGQLLKWQSDVGFYEGGNPANPGASYPGFLAGADGILFRTQFCLLF
ncbi:MAG: hypothetical protein JO112_04855 [Planctomycetes bacterium]|nr:hypothetical protein [Planctomycetota bacterium]